MIEAQDARSKPRPKGSDHHPAHKNGSMTKTADSLTDFCPQFFLAIDFSRLP